MKHPTPTWLSEAIIYEIYPQSFYDTNGDGIGDLNGIIAKLDYVASLGCSAIWLNPCFASPFNDAGYDVTDFCKVAPRYGTNSDMRRLCREAHRRDIHVILDLVAGHTSIDHTWFQKSAQAGKNKYSNWYIWTDNVWKNPDPPVTTIMGYSGRSGRYVPNFFHFQAALNYGYHKPRPNHPWQLPVDHPDVRAVRNELRRVMRFWLDMGIDGFRVDMAATLVKGDPEGEGNRALWKGIRKMFDQEYPEAILMAEWFFPKDALTAGFHVDFASYKTNFGLFRAEHRRCVFKDKLDGHSIFDAEGKGDVRQIMEDYLEHYQATKEIGYISLPTGNHDFGRLSQGRTGVELELAYVFLLTMPGIPIIYYGDEIGLRYQDALPSKEGGYGRTGSRTPMQWSRDRNAGFSTASVRNLYLPIDKRKDRPTVETQEKNSNSLLNFVRKLISLRKENAAFGADGEFHLVYAKSKNPAFAYLREKDGQRFLVAVNPGKKASSIPIPAQFTPLQKRLIQGRGVKVDRNSNPMRLSMSGFSYGIWEEIA
jgi:glycosidase